MYFNYFDCPFYRQFCEESLMRSPSPFGGPMGGPFEGPTGVPFGGQMGGPMGGPFGGPTGGQMGGPTGGPMGGPSQPSTGMPTTPPPNFKPSKAQATEMTAQGPGGVTTLVSAGSLSPCLYRFVYLWLTNGNEFWVYLTYLDYQTAAGFYWTGFNWAYFGIDLNRIDSFFCYI